MASRIPNESDWVFATAYVHSLVGFLLDFTLFGHLLYRFEAFTFFEVHEIIT